MKNIVFELLSSIQKLDDSDSDPEIEEVTEAVDPPTTAQSDPDNLL